MKVERLVRSGVIAMLFAGAWTMGCGAESPEVPDDDEEDDNGGTAGTGFPMGGTAGTGFPMGGTAGTPAVGGTAGTGFPMGGTAGTTPTGGTAGTTPTGGAAGSGTACGQTVATAADTNIDNLEDGDNTITMPRIGYWYTYNDKSTGCTQMPVPDMGGANPFLPAAMQGNGGTIGARMSGGGCATWGAGMGFDLANCNSKSGAYDATAFNGIAFWYKSSSAVRVMVGNLQNIPPNDANAPGGTCADAADMCFNHHGTNLAAAPTGMSTAITFTTLSQEYGTMRPFLKNQLINIQFQVPPTATTYDVVVDDLTFTP